ncbi:PPC domain-containing protein [Anatilimnocola floriformis]|uniref:PPC domain-containing protein n=1 Tax=Anatilimnocola floriformis TaxID=2948575 RepID=UPI0020C46383|nr:PPC domain-containing protein [Anatilimnocola floriformis]
MRFLTAAVLLACLVVSPQATNAQTAFPMLMSIKPVAATVGQSSEHVIVSRYTMYGAYQILVSGNGVTGEVLPSEIKAEDAAKKPVEQLKVRFQVAADALPGVRDVRVVMPTGVSTVGQLVIGTGPVAIENAANDSLDKATAVQVPATICGCVEKAEDVDFYKFHATAGQAFNFHVRCGRLQDKIHDLQLHCDPILMLRNSAGVTIAASDNYFRADPFLSQRFEQEGDYILEIRDVRYQGNQYWEYAIEISSQPFIECTFPLGISRGTTDISAAGFLLGDKPLSVNVDANIPAGEFWTTAKKGDQQTLPFAVEVTDLPLVTEISSDNNKPEQGQLLTAPCGLNGRLETEADVDYYTLEAKKGEALSLEIVARRRNSAIDSHLRILNEKGVQLQLSDDLKVGKRNYSDSWIENWTVPADGKYTIEIRDVHLRGGPRFPYFLQITRSKAYFELYLDTDKTQIPLGSQGVIYCRVERKNGFTGPVDLAIDGLPPSITATCGRIQAGKAVDGVSVLAAEPDAQLTVGSVRVTGTAVHEKDGEKLELSAVARPYQETYQPGGGRGHWPVDAHIVAVTDYGDIRRVNVSTQEIRLQPGGSQKIEVTIDRSPEFTTNVTLDMLYRHLASSFGDSLPPGVSLDDKQAKTLLAGSDTKGFVTVKAAADAPPVENHVSVVMAHVSLNFVMKTTYCSPAIRISVEPKSDIKK